MKPKGRRGTSLDTKENNSPNGFSLFIKISRKYVVVITTVTLLEIITIENTQQDYVVHNPKRLYDPNILCDYLLMFVVWCIDDIVHVCGTGHDTSPHTFRPTSRTKTYSLTRTVSRNPFTKMPQSRGESKRPTYPDSPWTHTHTEFSIWSRSQRP